MQNLLALMLAFTLYFPGARAASPSRLALKRAANRAATLADSFHFSTHSFAHYFSTLLGSAYLSASTPWNGTRATEMTLVGLYDDLEQDAYPYQAVIPTPEINWWNGSHWLDQIEMDSLDARGYLQTLDMRHAVLSTRYGWVDSDRVTRVETEEFLSRESPYLAVLRVQFTPDYGVDVGPVTASFSLASNNVQPFVWEGAALPGPLPILSLERDTDRRGFVAVCQTRNGKTQVAEAVRVSLPPNLPL